MSTAKKAKEATVVYSLREARRITEGPGEAPTTASWSNSSD
jgi:hypothetical protein